jgi:hypothetical protein
VALAAELVIIGTIKPGRRDRQQHDGYAKV